MTHPTWIFDLDNTLHDADHGIFPRINELMTRYIMDKLAINEEAAHALRERYWQQYGATLRGLAEHHAIDPHDFLRETHPTETFRPMLRWEPDLDSVLRALPGRKILLSNGPQHYVEDLLRAMGIHQHFCAHYGVERLDFTPKPAASAFRRVLVDHRLNAHDCVMIEDSLDNLKTAKSLGMKTVWLSRKPQRPDYVDARISRISELSHLALAG